MNSGRHRAVIEFGHVRLLSEPTRRPVPAGGGGGSQGGGTHGQGAGGGVAHGAGLPPTASPTALAALAQALGLVSSAGGGGGGGGGLPPVADMVKLFDSTLAVDTALIDTGANGIAQTQDHLWVLFLARTDEGTTVSSVFLSLNGSSGGVAYGYLGARYIGGTALQAASAVGTSGWFLPAYGDLGDSGGFTIGSFVIPAYRQTVARKQIVGLNGGARDADINEHSQMTAGAWSTTAISRMALNKNGGTVLRAGSRLSIYGF